jgi:hypothetical protein
MLKYISGTFHAPRAMPWFRWLVAGLSKRRPGFDPRSVYVRFVLENVAMEEVFFRKHRFSLLYIIPPKLHTHLYLHAALTRRKNARSLGINQKQCCFGNPGEPDMAWWVHHATRHNMPIHNILSTAPQLSISQKALGTLPGDGNVM